jgi:hypothetical protein
MTTPPTASLRAALLVLTVATPIAVVVACSKSVSTSPGTGDSGLGGSSSSSGGGCSCTVGNSGLHFTIPCGQSQCIDLNGQAIGYACGTGGATEDPGVCTSPPPVEAGSFDAGPCGQACPPPQTCGGGGVAGFCGCTPQSCSQLTLCGETWNDCDAAVDCPACEGGLYCRSDNHCRTPATTVVVFGNYQGGTFAINVDEHLPGLGIGLVSYDPMYVTIGGTYASDVVEVVHAGYDPGTTVTGVAPGDFADYLLPRASPDAGPGDIIVDDIPGLPDALLPTSGQIAQYFVTTLGGGTLLFHQCQYDAYSGTLLVSQGGMCN